MEARGKDDDCATVYSSSKGLSRPLAPKPRLVRPGALINYRLEQQSWIFCKD